MKFSILIPVYNVEKYLSTCLDSVLNQTFRDFEVICVNDGSTDNSLKILEEYSKKDKRIKIFSKSNCGLLWARRDGIKLASGEYVLFLDSDDAYHSNNALSLIDICLEKYNFPDLVIFDRAEIVDGKVVYTCPHFFEEERFFDEKSIHELRYNFISRNYLNAIFLKCIKTNVIKQDTTDYTVHNPQMAEDVTQSMFMFDKCKTIVFLPEFIYLYRRNNASITRTPLTLDLLEAKMVRRLFFDLYTLIKSWFLESYYSDVFQKFFNKAYSFYCDRILELFSNKAHKVNKKRILEFQWFTDDNLFLKNINHVKEAKLKASYRCLTLALIKDSFFYLNLGLIKYKFENFVHLLRSRISKLLKRKKNEN